MTCNPIRAIPRNSLLGDQTKTRRFEHPIRSDCIIRQSETILERAGFVDESGRYVDGRRSIYNAYAATEAGRTIG
jgi:hypothetical protein